MSHRRVLLWFRNDLRLHDNEALMDALRSAEEVIPVYIFDDRIFKGRLKYGARKTAVHRAKFIVESIRNLKANLINRGSNLLVFQGHAEDVLFELAKELKTSWVMCNRERTSEEMMVQDRLEQHLWSIGQEMRYSRGKMLYYTSDLPFPVTQTPDSFTQFRKEVEKIVPIRVPFQSPEQLLPLPDGITINDIPTLYDLGYDKCEIDQASVKFKGGETAGLSRLNYYINTSGLVRKYKETRNQLLGDDYSSKFSVYLAHGCLSPKQIYAALLSHEELHGANESTYHLYFELLWRDFFRLMGKKHGDAIFLKGGTQQSGGRSDLTDDFDRFKLWAEGRTGVPFIDAAMIELNTTGYMSNRARQNAASFLINQLGVNWQIGAEYFESKLIDYDPCSNWGNWNYLAGVGSDPREGRCFNIIKQAERYDAEATFVSHWLPALTKLPLEMRHTPYRISEEDQRTYQFVLGKDYPHCIVRQQLEFR